MTDSTNRVSISPEEYRLLLADKERVDYLENLARSSRTGVSVTHDKCAEGGYVLEKGFRAMRHHLITGFCPTVRDAIDNLAKLEFSGSSGRV